MIIRKDVLKEIVINNDNYLLNLSIKLPVPFDYIDLVYLVTCLLINLIYAINKKIIYETKKLFCKNLCRKKENLKINTFENSSKSSNKNTIETELDSYI